MNMDVYEQTYIHLVQNIQTLSFIIQCMSKTNKTYTFFIYAKRLNLNKLYVIVNPLESFSAITVGGNAKKKLFFS